MQQIKLNEPETLPTDGTIVLLFLHDGTVCNAFFSHANDTWVCCEDRFLLDGHDSHLIRGWLPLAYFEGFV